MAGSWVIESAVRSGKRRGASGAAEDCCAFGGVELGFDLNDGTAADGELSETEGATEGATEREAGGAIGVGGVTGVLDGAGGGKLSFLRSISGLGVLTTVEETSFATSWISGKPWIPKKTSKAAAAPSTPE